MSISDQSTSKSSGGIELVDIRFLSYSFILGRNGPYYTEIPASESEIEDAKKEFLDNFPEASNLGVKFFTLVPIMMDGGELQAFFCFKTDEALYVKASSAMAKSVFDQIFEIATCEGLKRIYIIVFKALRTFERTSKMLMYLGFKQVDLDIQKALCKTSAVLLALKV